MHQAHSSEWSVFPEVKVRQIFIDNNNSAEFCNTADSYEARGRDEANTRKASEDVPSSSLPRHSVLKCGLRRRDRDILGDEEAESGKLSSRHKKFGYKLLGNGAQLKNMVRFARKTFFSMCSKVTSEMISHFSRINQTVVTALQSIMVVHIPLQNRLFLSAYLVLPYFPFRCH